MERALLHDAGDDAIGKFRAEAIREQMVLGSAPVLHRAKGLTKTVTVQRVEQFTGRVTYRRSTVRKRLFVHARDDAADSPSQLARYLAGRITSSSPPCA